MKWALLTFLMFSSISAMGDVYTDGRLQSDGTEHAKYHNHSNSDNGSPKENINSDGDKQNSNLHLIST